MNAKPETSAPVDVLAVMDRMCEQASEGPHYGHCEAVAARAAVAELVAADRAYDKAVFALANCEHHELTFRRRDRAAAEQRRDAALAKFGGA